MEWKPTAGAKLAATLAALFDKGPEKVGYVFWGFLAMGVVKKEMEYCELECVINDKHLQRAVHLLEGSGHPSCTKNTCSELKEVRELSRDDPIHLSSTHPVGDAHFHLKDGFILHLFRQSTMLPWMDPIPEGPVEADDPDLILTTDPSLPRAREDGPSGRWIGLEPVKILNANCFMESIIWLMCRDLESNNSLMDRWHGMSILMHDTTRSTRRLRPEYQRVWDCLQYRGDYSDMRLHMFHELILLRKRLIANGSLPGNLPKISVRDWSVNRTWYSRLWCDLWLRW